MVKNPPANAGDARDADAIPGLGRSPEEGNGNPLQYSCLENSLDRGVWWARVHGVEKNWTRLRNRTQQHSTLEVSLKLWGVSVWGGEKHHIGQIRVPLSTST